MALQTVGIVGGGAWGTALGVSARRAGRDVILWAYEPETVGEINATHRNALYLPGVALDPAIKATAKLSEIAACDLVLMVTPAQELRAVGGELAPHMRTDQPLVIGAKGIEQSTGQLLSQVVAEVLPQVRTAVLSGPSFAAEIARGLPAALVVVGVAGSDRARGRPVRYERAPLGGEAVREQACERHSEEVRIRQVGSGSAGTSCDLPG